MVEIKSQLQILRAELVSDLESASNRGEYIRIQLRIERLDACLQMFDVDG